MFNVILIISDLRESGKEDLITVVRNSFSDSKIIFVIWDYNNKVFLLNGVKIDIWNQIYNSDAILFMVSRRFNKYKELGTKLENLKLLKFQNSISLNLLFNNRKSFHILMKKYNILKPGFLSITDYTVEEIFNSFTFPAVLRTKYCNHVSPVIHNLHELKLILDKNIFNNTNRDILIENFISDKVVHVLVIRNLITNHINSFGVGNDIDKQIYEYCDNIFDKLGVEKFALFELNIRNGKIYVIDIFTELNFLFRKKIIMKKIFKQYNLSCKYFFNFFSKQNYID